MFLGKSKAATNQSLAVLYEMQREKAALLWREKPSRLQKREREVVRP